MSHKYPLGMRAAMAAPTQARIAARGTAVIRSCLLCCKGSLSSSLCLFSVQTYLLGSFFFLVLEFVVKLLNDLG